MFKVKPLLAICLSSFLLLSACDGESSSNRSSSEDFDIPETEFTPARDTNGNGTLDDFDGDGEPDFNDDIGRSSFTDSDGDGISDDIDLIDGSNF